MLFNDSHVEANLNLGLAQSAHGSVSLFAPSLYSDCQNPGPLITAPTITSSDVAVSKVSGGGMIRATSEHGYRED
jgi:hypothetical protein